MSGPHSKFERWKKNIILFLGGQTISLFGSALVQYAIMWKITLDTQSGFMMTLYIICGFVPTFILSPFAGVWADRYNRKLLIVAADSLIAVATLFLAILFYSGYDAMWLLFAIAAVRAVGAGIQTPAVGAVLPQIVPSEHLTKVNGVNGSIQSLVTLVSPMIAAGLLSVASIEAVMLIDVATAAVAIAILMFFLHIPSHAKAEKAQPVSYVHDLKQGFAYIGQHRFLKQFFAFVAILNVMIAPAAFLTPLQVTRTFGAEVWRLSAIEIAFSGGMMLGGLIIAAWGGFRNRTYTIILGISLIGLCTVGLGIIPNFWIYLLVMLFTGVMLPIFNTPAMVLLQEKVEGDYLGRVFGVMSMLTNSMMPIGMLVFGPIADHIAIELLLMAAGACMIFISMLIHRNKTLIAAGQSSPAEG